MRLNEAGLLQKWFKDGSPRVDECFPNTKIKREQTAEGRGPLPLKGFSGAFVIFITGALIASTIFFIEIIIKQIVLFKNKNKITVI